MARKDGQSAKPRSMSDPVRNVIRSNDSMSLWNYTVAPGWHEDEVQCLRAAVMKFGVGRWNKIMADNILPGKTRAQLSLQTQRLLGQQSLAEFEGLHVDPCAVGNENIKKQGPEIKRKNGMIVRTGAYPSREEILAAREEHRARYGLTDAQVEAVVIPTVTRREEVLDMEDQARAMMLKKVQRDVMKQKLELIKKVIAEKKASEPAAAASATKGNTATATAAEDVPAAKRRRTAKA